MAKRYDAIVIGSGFGGAVVACRLAEKGHKVLVLERGRRWGKDQYPRKPDDPWIYDPQRPEKDNGWIDLRLFKSMAVVQGAAVGGGSLIYANISVEAPRQVFKQGWPPEISYAELKPYYDRVAKTMNVGPVPEGQIPERTRLMREGAAKIGAADRFQMLPLAVTFSPNYDPHAENPRADSRSEAVVNRQGVAQGTCVHCGNCDIGCQVHAKNTLDLNYIPWAEKHRAEVRPLHLARVIRPEGSGYRVDFERVENGRLVPGFETADRVFLAAGSLGSTELLLRCRDEHRTLPNVSAFLGRDWSSNGDFLTPAYYKTRKISPSWGPTITSAIDFLDGSEGGQQFFIEDGGFPDLLADYLMAGAKGAWFTRGRLLRRELKKILPQLDPLGNFMPWFAQGIDASDGRLSLQRPWYAPFGKTRLDLDWKIARSEGLFNAIVAMHKKLSAATGGEPWVPPTWSRLKSLATPHPLGGCGMGSTRQDGVVDHRGEVFGHPNLFVVDGSIVPKAVGRNPSRTIAALAERIAALIP